MPSRHIVLVSIILKKTTKTISKKQSECGYSLHFLLGHLKVSRGRHTFRSHLKFCVLLLRSDLIKQYLQWQLLTLCFLMAPIVGLEPTIQFNLYDRLAICSITIIAYRQNGVGDENWTRGTLIKSQVRYRCATPTWLEAGVGLEPTTFWLWARQATAALPCYKIGAPSENWTQVYGVTSRCNNHYTNRTNTL